jgi:DNA-binding CsgD family transcriptional regulator
LTHAKKAALHTPTLTVDQFSELTRLVYEGTLDPAAWRLFLKGMCEKLNGNAAVIILRIPRLGEVPLKVDYGAIPELSPPYFRKYMAMDPFVQLPEGRAVTLHDFTHPNIEESEYFRDYLEPMDMVYVIGVDLSYQGRHHVRLRLCRPRRAGNFSASDCQLVEAFVPHLKTAIRVFSELDVVASERTVYADAMDQLTLASIVVDDSGKILHATRLAESILAENDGISRCNDLLFLANREDSKRFHELLSRAVEAQRSAKPALVDVMRVRRTSGRPDIGVVVRPSTSGVDKDNERLTASIAVFLSTTSVESREQTVPADVIQKLFGLTPKEAVLALRLASGESLHEASEQLGISPNTGRAHLRSIFAKTGVDRQVRLVRVLLKSVAMLGQ